MACPFFMPSRRLEHVGWVVPPRLPLGDPWGGTCHARADDVIEPPDLHQRELCNCGYARGRCDRFPGGEARDAVRFSIISDRGGVVRMVYVLEKDHAPASHGVLEFREAGEITGVSDLLAQQAKAFLVSYLHRRTPAGKLGAGSG